MQISEIFHQVASEGTSDFLKKLAEKFGWSEDEVIIVAINRMYRDTFHANEEFDYPTEEELAHWEKLGLIERDNGGKSQQLTDFCKRADDPVVEVTSSLRDILGKSE